ncbi:MAG: phosphatidate cytidylyltransferase [Ignavibacteriales bacterium]
MTLKENSKRVIVALIAIPLILIAVYLGKFFFFGFVVSISLMAYYEFCQLVKNKNANANLFIGSFFILLLLINQYRHFIDVSVIIIIASLVLLITELFRNKGSAIINLGSTFLGIFYIGIFSTTFIALREFYPSINELYIRGAYLVFSVLASIWMGDSAAYYGGTALGRHKLFPRVSPKKSWEGAIFGFIFSLLTLILAKLFVLDFLNWHDGIIIGIIIGIIGQVGDLVESLFKRDSAVKDSSALIPGHGGFFDRFDSLFFSAPVIWLYLRYLS